MEESYPRDTGEDLDNDPFLNLEVTKNSFLLAMNILTRIQSDVWLSVNISPKYMGDGKGLCEHYQGIQKI